MDRLLIILDIDETLVSSVTANEPDPAADFFLSFPVFPVKKRSKKRLGGPYSAKASAAEASEAAVKSTASTPPGYQVSLRPWVREFLSEISSFARLAIWSVAEEDYVAEIVRLIKPEGVALEFIRAGNQCTRRFDADTREAYYIKKLKLIRRRFPLERVLIVDDSPRTAEQNYGNLVKIPAFNGDKSDNILPSLARYLRALSKEDNLRKIEKRGWHLRGY